MAKKVYEEENIRAIADKIREKTGSNETYKTSEIPHGIEMVYKAGQESGIGYEEAYEAGQKAEYDRFWDIFQTNGTRRNYAQGFAGVCWKDENYNPKYPIIVTNMASNMFNNNTGITSTKVPITIDTASAASVFQGATRLKEIPSLKVTEKVSAFSYWFNKCNALETINFTEDSVISNDISFADCTQLTHDSLMSIINALKDLRAFERIDIYNDEKYSGTSMHINVYPSSLSDKIRYDDYEYKVIEMSLSLPALCYVLQFDFDWNTEDGVWPDEYSLGLTWVCFETTHPYETNAERVKAIKFHDDNTFTFILAPTETKTLTLGATNLAKLTDEEKAIATDKGWVLA